MTEDKEYTLKELKKKLTEKERIFCHQYIIDWNGSKAARVAGYSEKTCAVIANENLRKPYIQQYIDFIKNDIEKEAGISKLKQVREFQKIAYSSIAHMHDTWITRKEFEELTEDQKSCIAEISTQLKTARDIDGTLRENEYVKIKLYDKQRALENINKMMGYNEAEKHDHSSKDGSMNPNVNIIVTNKKASKELNKLINGDD